MSGIEIFMLWGTGQQPAERIRKKLHLWTAISQLSIPEFLLAFLMCTYIQCLEFTVLGKENRRIQSSKKTLSNLQKKRGINIWWYLSEQNNGL